MIRALGATFITLAALVPAAAQSQETFRRAMPKPADTVRVWSSTPSLDGQLGVVRTVGTDTLLVGLRTNARVFVDTPIAKSAMSRIDVMTGRGPKGSRTFASTLGGVLLGGVLGGSIGYAASDPSEVSERGTQTAFCALGGLAIGGVIGAYLGSQPVAKWVRVY